MDEDKRSCERREAIPNFYWQNGYAGFSVSPDKVDNLIRYIDNQKEHHKTETFQEEMRKFLKWYKMDYDERYL